MISGFTLIGAGLIGTLLPVMPGVPLLIAGVAIVGPGHPLLKPVLARIGRWRHRKEVS
jgi:uncharacterized membrane protein YbaN (DUF454 family)